MSRVNVTGLNMTMAVLPWFGLALASFICGAGSSHAAVPPETAKEAIETVVVELGPDGFYPKEIQRKAGGKFYIFMRIGVGQEPLALQMENAAGVALKRDNLPNVGKRWGQLIDVPAGKYVLRVPGKANMAINIAVP